MPNSELHALNYTMNSNQDLPKDVDPSNLPMYKQKLKSSHTRYYPAAMGTLTREKSMSKRDKWREEVRERREQKGH